MHRQEVRILIVMLVGVVILAVERWLKFEELWGAVLIGAVWGYFGLKFIMAGV